MNKIPCKKCPKCGLYNDFTIEECECGKKLNSVKAQFVDTDIVSPEEYGEINTSLKVYMQKCSACGEVSYTDTPSNRIKVCYNCNKKRIAAVDPVEYVEEDSEDKQRAFTTKAEVTDDGDDFDAQQTESQVMQKQLYYATDVDNDDVSKWKDILGNIRKTVRSTPEVRISQSHTQQIDESKVTQDLNNFDDDDGEVTDWVDILDPIKKTNFMSDSNLQAPSTPAKKDITLTAIRYGQLSFTVKAGKDTYMLGRSANQRIFLSQDEQVGNEHCYLFFRNGTWFVRDNSSQNGTAVNGQNIGLNGESMLSDGDELKLGHNPNSVAFRISIK